MLENRYQQALDFIYSFIDYEREPGPRARTTFDLRRVEELMGKVGNPHLKARSVHVAGTKGKGSVAAMIATVLTAAGFTTGLFTSPHLHSYNERIRVDNKPIPDEDIVYLVDKLKPAVEAVNHDATYGQLTTFEVTTALGFMHFAGIKADFQVIEVGLGGRLDATNVIQPEVCIITSISYDHTDLLGNTLAEIAAEKAGIIKQGSVVVSSSQVEEAKNAIVEQCKKSQAEFISVGQDVTWRNPGFESNRQLLQVKGRMAAYDLSIPLLGQHQLDNTATAVAALEVLIEKGFNISKDHITEGLAKVVWEARLQVLNRKPLVVVDGAHNVDSVQKLKQSLRQYFNYDRAILIIGFSSDKNLTGMVSEVAPFFNEVIATRSIHPRAMATAPIVAEFARHGVAVRETDDISIALPLALELAGDKDIICVTGSLFVAAGAIEQVTPLGLTV